MATGLQQYSAVGWALAFEQEGDRKGCACSGRVAVRSENMNECERMFQG